MWRTSRPKGEKTEDTTSLPTWPELVDHPGRGAGWSRRDEQVYTVSAFDPYPEANGKP